MTSPDLNGSPGRGGEIAERLEARAKVSLWADATLYREAATQIASLTAERDEARQSEAELEQACKDLDLRIEELESALSLSGGGDSSAGSTEHLSPSATRPEDQSPAGHKVHVLKTHPGPFAAVRARKKWLEIRRADRDFAEGDTLWLDEYDPETDAKSGEVEIRVITHVLPGGQYGIEAGYVALSISEATLSSPNPILSGEGGEP